MSKWNIFTWHLKYIYRKKYGYETLIVSNHDEHTITHNVRILTEPIQFQLYLEDIVVCRFLNQNCIQWYIHASKFIEQSYISRQIYCKKYNILIPKWPHYVSRLICQANISTEIRPEKIQHPLSRNADFTARCRAVEADVRICVILLLEYWVKGNWITWLRWIFVWRLENRLMWTC